METKDKSGKLFDYIIKKNGLGSDASLAEFLEVTPSLISKIRNGQISVGATTILYIHENFALPVGTIRQMIEAK